MTSHAPSDRQRLLDLFDALADLGEDHVLLETRHPDASVVLRQWAESRGLACTRVTTGADHIHDGYWSAKLPNFRSIDVWTVAADSRAA
jgi:hypothetical protein